MPKPSPTFAGLTIDGEVDAGSLSVANGAGIGGTLTVTGAMTVNGLFTANGGITASSFAHSHPGLGDRRHRCGRSIDRGESLGRR
jgi:hypothetical protein